VDVRTRVDEKIQQLSDDPRPTGAIKLKGSDNQYRIRVGDYRIRYSVHDETVVVQILQCGHRRDIYRDKG